MTGEAPLSGGLKPGWRRVKFSEVVRQVKDKVDPVDSGLERYIAGEHMDTDDLKLRRWGEIGADYLGPAFHMRFKPGHVLYGSRRTYLRKVAVADFEGITANTTFVLEPKDPNVLLPELLPFLMQTERFHEHSVKQSRGSVNPYVNFSDLAWYEFALPPLEEQRRISAAYTTLDCLIEELKATLTNSHQLRESLINSFFSDSKITFASKKLGELGFVSYGLTVNQARRHSSEQKPYLRVANVQRGRFDLAEVKRIGTLEGDEGFELAPGDILLVEGHADVNEIGRGALWNGEIDKALHQNHLIRFRADSRQILPAYALAFINSPAGRVYFRSRAKSTSGLNTINSSVVREMPMVVAAISEQESFCDLMREADQRIVAISMRLADAIGLRRALFRKALI